MSFLSTAIWRGVFPVLFGILQFALYFIKSKNASKLLVLTLRNKGVSSILFGIFGSAPNDNNSFNDRILLDNIDK